MRRSAGPHDEAAEELWPRERCEQGGRRSDVESDGVDRREPERVDRLRDELAHLLRREKILAGLGPPEAGQVEREHLELLRQPCPHGSKGEDALRPWAEEHDLLAAPPIRRVADLQPVDGLPRDVERLLLLDDFLAHGPILPSGCPTASQTVCAATFSSRRAQRTPRARMPCPRFPTRPRLPPSGAPRFGSPGSGRPRSSRRSASLRRRAAS